MKNKAYDAILSFPGHMQGLVHSIAGLEDSINIYCKFCS